MKSMLLICNDDSDMFAENQKYLLRCVLLLRISVVVLTVWNSLHINICSAETLLTFRSGLKTELFLDFSASLHRCAPDLLATDIRAHYKFCS